LNTSYREESKAHRGCNVISVLVLVRITVISYLGLTVVNFRNVLNGYFYYVFIMGLLMQGELLVTPKKDT
jgi:hypothetical protein